MWFFKKKKQDPVEQLLVLEKCHVDNAYGTASTLHQIIFSHGRLYIIGTNTDYSAFFEGVTGLVGGVFGIVGEILGEITGSKLGSYLKDMAASRSKKKVQKVLHRLDEYADKENGVTRIAYDDLKQFSYKKGYWINGSSGIELKTEKEKWYFRIEKRHDIEEVIAFLKNHAPQTKIQRVLVWFGG